jgi:hypothetical protein
MVLIKADGGVRKNWLATRVVLICALIAARNKISLITTGQASASTQIFMMYKKRLLNLNC